MHRLHGVNGRDVSRASLQGFMACWRQHVRSHKCLRNPSPRPWVAPCQRHVVDAWRATRARLRLRTVAASRPEFEAMTEAARRHDLEDDQARRHDHEVDEHEQQSREAGQGTHINSKSSVDEAVSGGGSTQASGSALVDQGDACEADSTSLPSGIGSIQRSGGSCTGGGVRASCSLL